MAEKPITRSAYTASLAFNEVFLTESSPAMSAGNCDSLLAPFILTDPTVHGEAPHNPD